jgi:hypothetical protein
MINGTSRKNIVFRNGKTSKNKERYKMLSEACLDIILSRYFDMRKGYVVGSRINRKKFIKKQCRRGIRRRLKMELTHDLKHGGYETCYNVMSAKGNRYRKFYEYKWEII